MSASALKTRLPEGLALLPSHWIANDAVPWIPLGEKKAMKPLRILSGNRGFVELLRIEPGEVIPLHRHTGEVHGFHLEGVRELQTGERVGPGDYVYEPAGNVDTWKVVSDTPVVVFLIVMGEVEYFDAEGNVRGRFTAETMRQSYLDYCSANGLSPVDLDE